MPSVSQMRLDAGAKARGCVFHDAWADKINTQFERCTWECGGPLVVQVEKSHPGLQNDGFVTQMQTLTSDTFKPCRESDAEIPEHRQNDDEALGWAADVEERFDPVMRSDWKLHGDNYAEQKS